MDRDEAILKAIYAAESDQNEALMLGSFLTSLDASGFAVVRKEAPTETHGALSGLLTIQELKLVDNHCDWPSFKCAFAAVMKARREKIRATLGESEKEKE